MLNYQTLSYMTLGDYATLQFLIDRFTSSIPVYGIDGIPSGEHTKSY